MNDQERTFQCPQCGKQHSVNARFCPATGKPIAAPTAAFPMPHSGRGGNLAWLYVLLMAAGVVLMLTGGFITLRSLPGRSGEISASGQERDLGMSFRESGQWEYNPDAILAYSPDHRYLGVGLGNELRLLTLPAAGQAWRTNTPEEIAALGFSPDGRLLAAGSRAGVVYVYDAGAGELAYTIDGGAVRVEAVTFSEDGQYIVFNLRNGLVILCRAADGSLVQRLHGPQAPVACLQVSPDGELLAGCDPDGRVYVWRLDSGERLYVLQAPTDHLNQLAFSSAGGRLAAGSSLGIHVWDLASGELVRTLGDGPAWRIFYSLDGLYIFCGCNRNVEIWQVRDGRLRYSYALDADEILDAGLASDGSLLVASLSGDRAATWRSSRMPQSIARAFSSSPDEDEGPEDIGEARPASPRPTRSTPEPASASKLATATRPAASATPVPTRAPSNTPLPTPTLRPTATPAPTEVPATVRFNAGDGAEMVFIPAGEFTMGSNAGSDPYFYGAEGPPHEVYLDAFWIYRTEVTNVMYAACVAEQACPRPERNASNTRDEYYGNPAFDDYPVVYISWNHASEYCRWAGGRLPTEAEWEKAARGEDGRLFAWGDQAPNGDLAQFSTGDTAPVGSHPAGASPYGAYDMSGNVIEWVFDYFQSTYYPASPYENPRGPSSGSSRTYRSGSYHNTADAIRVVMRGSRSATHAEVDIGFRCAVDDSGQ